MDKINRTNYYSIFSNYIKHEKLRNKDIAESIGCSISTLERLLSKSSSPSDEMIKQTTLLMTIGMAAYKRLSKKQRNDFSDKVGKISGGSIGLSAIPMVVSSLGISGLSGAGITTGLSALGALVGGGMVIGIGLAALLPITCGLCGFGVVRCVKHISNKINTTKKTHDSKWEVSAIHK